MLVSFPWRSSAADNNIDTFCVASCDPCGAFGGGDVTKIIETDETDNTTLSTHSPSRDSQSNISLNKHAENDAPTQFIESPPIETLNNPIEVEATTCENIRYLIEDATLCAVDGVCCRRTCDDSDNNSLLPETCGVARRALRKRRSERAHKHSQLCCTTISWGPDDEEDISVLQDPIIEENEYDSGLNRGNVTPEHSIVSQEDRVTPKHRNSFRNKLEKCCAYCGVTKEEANNCMKICSRCRAAYYCSKECQSEDWYNAHKMTCVPIQE